MWDNAGKLVSWRGANRWDIFFQPNVVSMLLGNQILQLEYVLRIYQSIFSCDQREDPFGSLGNLLCCWRWVARNRGVAWYASGVID